MTDGLYLGWLTVPNVPLGSLAEWFGAIATTLAAIVALYFGLRDQRRIERRQASRQTLHDDARELLLHVQRIRTGRSSEQRKLGAGHLDDDVEASRLFASIVNLGRVRRWRAMRVLRAIYSAESIAAAPLDRSHLNAEQTLGAIFWELRQEGRDVNHRKRALRHTAVVGRGSQVELAQLERLYRRLTRI